VDKQRRARASSGHRPKRATIVIPVWNAWKATQACLDSLRATISPDDEVVVVDNGSGDETGKRLHFYPWVKVVSNDNNLGFAAACNQAIEVSSSEIVVFLHNDTLVPPRWLDRLIAPFADADVAATGGMSNYTSSTMQLARGVSCLAGDLAQLREASTAWARLHHASLRGVEYLAEPCIAVRRSAFEAVGGFVGEPGRYGFEYEILSSELALKGWNLVVTEDVFIYHEGHSSFQANGIDWFTAQQESMLSYRSSHGTPPPHSPAPLVSACLIAKDEERSLPDCIASMDDFVDEIVLYDTGSSDSTKEIARSQGAKVIEGYWDDDFARARNEALKHCRGEWILWMDADETLECPDKTSLRHSLALQPREVEGFIVAIDNLTGTGANSKSVHTACRLFRAQAGEWVGTLHEYLMAKGNKRALGVAMTSELRITHYGYLNHMLATRNKLERNLAIAKAAVERARTPAERGIALVNLGRTIVGVGTEEGLREATTILEEGIALIKDYPIVIRVALRAGIEACILSNRSEDALSWIKRLRESTSTPAYTDALEARVLINLGRPEEALSLLDRLPEKIIDEDGFEYLADSTTALRSKALAMIGRPDEAANVLLSLLAKEGILDTSLNDLIELLIAARRDITEMVEVLPKKNLVPFLAQLVTIHPQRADILLEALYAKWPEMLSILATAARIAPELPIARALVWSSRLRAYGLVQSCPLTAMAVDTRRHPVERAVCAATIVGSFGDESAIQLLAEALRLIDETERVSVEASIGILWPDFNSKLLEANYYPPLSTRQSSLKT